MRAAMATVNTPVYGNAMTDRLTPADWIAHGLDTLARRGPNALRVGAMAAGLHVSRGSFYWHFRDIGDFRDRLLKAWLDEATEQVIARIDAAPAGPGRLKALLRSAFVTRPGLADAGRAFAAEAAIRAWAVEDPAVAAMVAAVDERRISYICGELAAAGLDSRTALGRATFLYWAYLGEARAMNARDGAVDSAAIDDIAALFVR
ncbi:hypothetical protein BN1110_02821 [bacterium YEK0313]|nr:hypothetical protein BN1110_02821 [bacterium YEK0313]